MIAALAVIVLASMAGFGAVRLIAPRSPLPLAAGAAFPVGVSIPAAALLAASLIGLEWSRALFIGFFLVVTLGLLAAAWARREPALEGELTVSFSWIDPLWMILVLGYAFYATAGPVAEYDFIGIWGVKARTFFLGGGVDLEWLSRPWNDYTHPDYPILLPLVYDQIALFAGQWEDRWIGLFFPACAASVLIVLRACFEGDSGSRHLAALATLALVPFAASPYLGLAEGPLIAFGTTGVVLMREGIRRDRMDLVTLAAIVLGLAANTKNEGLTLFVAVAAASLVSGAGRRVVWRLWPAVALIVPWLALRSIYGLQTDLTRGSVFERIWLHLKEAHLFVEVMVRYPLGNTVFWTGIAIGIFLVLGILLRRERFLLSVLAVQYGFYILAYLSTPHSIDWHFKWSWERVLNQLTLLLGFAVISGLIALFRSETPAVVGRSKSDG